MNSITENKHQIKSKEIYLRKGLVVLQFFVAISLVISTVVIIRQVNLFKDSTLGFNKENMIVVSDAFYLSKSQVQFFKTDAMVYRG